MKKILLGLMAAVMLTGCSMDVSDGSITIKYKENNEPEIEEVLNTYIDYWYEDKNYQLGDYKYINRGLWSIDILDEDGELVRWDIEDMKNMLHLYKYLNSK